MTITLYINLQKSAAISRQMKKTEHITIHIVCLIPVRAALYWQIYLINCLILHFVHITGPFTVPIGEEVESQHLKFIMSPPEGMTFHEAVMRFNSNVSYSGLLHAVTQTDVSFECHRNYWVRNQWICLL